MKKLLSILALTQVILFGSSVAQASPISTIHKVKFQLWYEGIKSQPKIQRIDENISKDKPSKSVSSTNYVEELSRPMHLVLKKHQIILNQ